MPPLNGGNPADFINTQINEAENLYETARENFGKRRNPLQLELGELPWGLREEIRDLLMSGYNMPALMNTPLDDGSGRTYRDMLTAIKSEDDVNNYARVSGSPFYSGTLPADEFRNGRGTTNKLLFNLLSQKDQTGENISGNIPRKAYLESALEQVQHGIDFDANHGVWDIETAGLTKNTDVRELAAKFIVNGEERRHTLYFRSAEMEEGLYPGKQSFEDFFQQQRREAGLEPARFIDRATMDSDEAVLAFLRDAAEVQRTGGFMIGQNVAFDNPHIQRMFTSHTAYKAGGEYAQLVDELMALTTPERTVDTRLLAGQLIGDIDVAPQLKRVDKFTRFSIANMLLSTDAIAQDPGLRDMVARGTHAGDVDIDITENLARKLDQLARTGEGLALEALGDANLANEIVSQSAVTPHTPMNALGGLTPLQYSISESRGNLMAGARDLTDAQMRDIMFHGSSFKTWLGDVMGSSGILRGKHLSMGFEEAQRAAIAVGMPFAGLSAPEQALSAILGRMGVGNNTKVNAARNLVGDIIRGGAFESHEKARIVGGADGKIVALPMGLLEQSPVGEQLRATFSGEGPPQRMRVSAFEYFRRDKEGSILSRTPHYDVGLTLDLEQNQIDELVDYVRNLKDPELLKQFGLVGDGPFAPTPERVANTLAQYGKDYGIQLGISGSKNEQQARIFYNVQQQLHANLDQSNSINFHTYGYGSKTLADRTGKNVLYTGPVIADVGLTPEREAFLVDEMARQRQATEYVATQVQGNPLMRGVIGGGQMGKKFYSATESLLRNLPKRVGIGAGVLTGYYLFRKNREQNEYDDPFATMQYEAPGPTEIQARGQREREAPPLIMPGGQRQDPLATAGTTLAMHEARQKHMIMGPQKYDHLF